MNRRKIQAIFSVIALSFFASNIVAAPGDMKITGADLMPAEVYSPYVGRAYPDQVFFGDTHLHTKFSPDAGLIGTTLSPADSFRFARGEKVIASSGQPVQLIRPLDFLVITDHAEYAGLAPMIRDSDPALLSSEYGRFLYEKFKSGPEGAMEAFGAILQDAAKQNEATVYLYGDIGGYFGIEGEEFVKEFNAINADIIHLRIDTDGGDIFTARSMKTAIMQHKAKVIGHVDGLAASAGSFLLMGCDEIEIVDGGFIMIHRAMSFIDIFGYFDTDDLDDVITDVGKERSLHEKINESIANDYVKGTGNNQGKVLAWMVEETWFTAKEAVENKFADRIYDGEPVKGSYDLSIYANVPEEIKARNQKVSKRAIEKALRDVGLSNKEAKTVLAEGLQDGQRDVEPPDPPPDQRDVEPVVENKKDRVAALLTRAEVVAPSTVQ